MPASDTVIRMKVWVHPENGKTYLVAMGAFDPQTMRVHACAMTDDDTVQITATLVAWNALPYHYFKDVGPATKPEERTFDLDKFLKNIVQLG